MANTCRMCRVPQCGDEATHVLATYTSLHGGHWPREAMRADQAPQIRIRPNSGPLEERSAFAPPVPYYCAQHAQEHSHA